MNPGPFPKFVEGWKSSGVQLVCWRYSVANPLDLQITALLGRGTSVEKYLIFDAVRKFVGLDDGGKPTTKVIDPAPVQATTQPQATKPISAATKSQISELIANAGRLLAETGGSVDAALVRFTTAAARKAGNQAKRRLGQLVQVLASH